MDTNNETTQSLREALIGEHPLQRSEKNIYIAAVREHFTEILFLRKEGFSFVQICRALVKNKKLPEDMKVRCLQQAFRRELIKQEREGFLMAFLNDASKLAAKKLVEKPEKQKPPQNVNAQELDAEALEKERKRKLGVGRVIPAIGGDIIITGDGGFEF